MPRTSARSTGCWRRTRRRSIGTPAEARAAVAFLHGLAAWDFREASAAADTLLAAAAHGDFWIPADLLREGGSIAKLRAGDLAGAKAAYVRLHSVSARTVNDVRPQLVGAWISAATQGRER